MVNIDKLICSLIDNGSMGLANILKNALKEQGIDFKDGKLYSFSNKNFKFDVGDWVIDNSDGQVYHIWGMTSLNSQYMLEDQNGTISPKDDNENLQLRLWTLEDAREGDVLTNGKVVFIYKGMTKHNSILVDCSTENIDEYQIYDIENVIPATMAQKKELSDYLRKEKLI